MGLAVVAAGVLVGRLRVLMYRAPLPARPFRRVLVAQVGAGELDRARALAEAARPSWVGEMAAHLLDVHAEGGDPEAELDPFLLELRYEATRGLWSVRALAALASAGGLLGAVWVLLRLLQGDHGLEGLMAGLPERLAFERALLSLLLGAVTASVCLYARAVLARQARRLLREVREISDALLDALGVKDPDQAP
ncbi:MAG: hypothetical protein ACOC97_04070 [Myxococcota bacterium]